MEIKSLGKQMNIYYVDGVNHNKRMSDCLNKAFNGKDKKKLNAIFNKNGPSFQLMYIDLIIWGPKNL